jgi:GTP-dependent phosphoenolpyruvate carboxykinase
MAGRPLEKPIPQIDEIALSIKNSSSKELAQYFDSTVEIKLSDSRGDFSKNQAEIVMRDFFKKYPAENFLILQQGESAEKISFLIGRYQSKSHAFRVLVKGKSNNDDQLKIYGLEFTKE